MTTPTPKPAPSPKPADTTTSEEKSRVAAALRENRVRRLQIVEAVDRLLSDSLDPEMTGKVVIEIDVRKGRIGRGRKTITYDRL